MTLKDGAGPPLLAERLLGGGRHPVEGGLAERRTGSTCLGAPSAFSGRQRWEERPPEGAAGLRRLAAAPAQQDPTFRTTWASTRLTAHATVAALRAQGSPKDPRPAPSTRAEGRNRRGFRLRQVLTATPQKQMAEPDALFDHMEKTTMPQSERATSNACAAIVKPRWPSAMGPGAVCPAGIPQRGITP
jgi:hypothetical protein